MAADAQAQIGSQRLAFCMALRQSPVNWCKAEDSFTSAVLTHSLWYGQLIQLQANTRSNGTAPPTAGLFSSLSEMKFW